MSRHKRMLGSLVVLALAASFGACQGLPPMQLVVVISPTPAPNVIMITMTPTGENTASTPYVMPTLTPMPPPATTLVSDAATSGPTPTLSAFPTETRAQLYIAQQDFEHGYMYWISTRKVVWVLIVSPSNPNAGEWRIYNDTFVDGEPEVDPNLNPPNDKLYQPRRGFGKLWRETPGLRDALGWATTPEFALNTTYVYQPGGYLDKDGKYVLGPGKHFLTNLDRQTFAFYKSADGFGRWERVN